MGAAQVQGFNLGNDWGVWLSYTGATSRVIEACGSGTVVHTGTSGVIEGCGSGTQGPLAPQG